MTERQNGEISDMELKNKSETFNPNKDRNFDVYSVDTSFGYAKRDLERKTDELVGMAKEMKHVGEEIDFDKANINVISDERMARTIDAMWNSLGLNNEKSAGEDNKQLTTKVELDDSKEIAGKKPFWKRVQESITNSRPVRTVSGAIMALVTSFQLGQGISAMAEQDKTVPQSTDAPVEDGLNGVVAPDSFPTEEGQITAKGGVGDLLANANNGVVTSGDVGVEVPKSDGGEVQYASNVTNENGEPVIVPLEGGGSSEVEKTQEQMIIENINDYLSIGEKYSDENIKNILIKSKVEKTKDLGLIHSRNVQGVLLGYFGDNNSDNIIVFFGTKGPKLERLVTVAKIPFYVINDVSAPLKFSLLGSNSTLDDGNGRSTKNGNEILSILDSQNGRVIIVGMYTDKITDELVKRAANYNSKSENRYVQDLKDSTYPSRSLGGMVYRNGIQDFEYNEKVNLWKIYSGADIDEIKQFCSLVCSSDTKNIPITVDLTYLSQ